MANSSALSLERALSAPFCLGQILVQKTAIGRFVLSHRDENHFVFCGIAASNIPLQDSEVQAGQVTTGLFGAHYDYAPGTFPAQMAGDWLTLQAKTSTVAWGNTRIECVTHRSGTTGTAAFEGDADIEGDVGIRTSGVDASFDYVFVVAIGT